MTTDTVPIFKDEVIHHIIITLSVKDRLKVLLGRRIRVSMFTKTEHKVGGVQATSDVTIERLFKKHGIKGKGIAV